MASGDQEQPRKGERRGRPPWVPPDPSMVTGLAQQGMSMEAIAVVLGCGLSTLYRKKAQFREFREAFRKGAAQGEALASGKLMEAIKNREAWAICFYLKTHGWRENPAPGVNVNIGKGFGGEPPEFQREQLEESKTLLSWLTVAERKQLAATIRERMKQARDKEEPAFEVQARRIEDKNGTGSNGTGNGAGGE